MNSVLSTFKHNDKLCQVSLEKIMVCHDNSISG